jgi:hypothetical protein
MISKRAFLLIGGPMNGKRVVLRDTNYYVVMKPREPMRFCDLAENPDVPVLLETIEYRPVQDIPGVLAPRNIPATLVLDMLVEGYAR